MDCIFCKIINKEVKTEFIYQDSDIVAFADINPKAKIHILIVPCEHITSINNVEFKHAKILGKLFLAAKKIAQKKGVAKDGYKLVINTGDAAGQVIDHLHVHFLAGENVVGLL